MVGQGKDIGGIQEITIEIDHIAEAKVEMEKGKVQTEIDLVVERKDKGQEKNLEIEIEAEKEEVGPLQDLGLLHVSVQTGIDLDAIDVVSMTILQENSLMHRQMKKSGSDSEDIDDSTWQMLSQVETLPFQDFDTQDINL